jgi:hypothetical protein
MDARPTFAQLVPLSISITAAALATIIAVCLLAGISLLFQSVGAPFELLAASERACIERVYISEREACMREWLASARASNIASKRDPKYLPEDSGSGRGIARLSNHTNIPLPEISDIRLRTITTIGGR